MDQEPESQQICPECGAPEGTGHAPDCSYGKPYDEAMSPEKELEIAFQARLDDFTIAAYNLRSENLDKRAEARVSVDNFLDEQLLQQALSDEKSINNAKQAAVILENLSQNPNFVDLAYDFTAKYKDRIEKSIDNDNILHEQTNAAALNCLSLLTRRRRTTKAGIESIRRHMEIIRQSYVEQTYSQLLPAIGALFDFGFHREEGLCLTLGIKSSLQKEESISGVGALAMAKAEKLAVIGRETIEAVLTKAGLDQKTLYAWQESAKDKAEAIDKNLNTLRQIESRRPGSAAILAKEFGILDFGRYQADTLIRQFDNRDNDMPYGVIIYPRADHNGAFYQNPANYASLGLNLGSKTGLRIVECDGKYELARRMAALNKRYGGKHKISFAIIGGHGTPDSIRFGTHTWKLKYSPEEKMKKSAVFKEDLMGKGFKKSSEYFIADPTIILVSCSTGQNEGIGQKLSKVFGCQVIAPEEPAALQTIRSKYENGRWNFQVDYSSEVATKQYLAGKEEEPVQKEPVDPRKEQEKAVSRELRRLATEHGLTDEDRAQTEALSSKLVLLRQAPQNQETIDKFIETLTQFQETYAQIDENKPGGRSTKFKIAVLLETSALYLDADNVNDAVYELLNAMWMARNEGDESHNEMDVLLAILNPLADSN